MFVRGSILIEEMVSLWLQEHRAEYDDATETIKACMVNFKLHRRHRRLVWVIYSRPDFGHLKVRRENAKKIKEKICRK